MTALSAAAVLAAAGGIISHFLPLVFPLVWSAGIAFAGCIFMIKTSKAYQQEIENAEQEVSRMQALLIDAQKPDETSLRAKELLPVGNTFLMQAAEGIRQKVDIAGILGFINTIMIERLFADGGVILTIEEFEDVLAVKAYSGDYPPPYKLPDDVPHKKERVITNFKYAEFSLTDSFFGEAALSAKPILIEDASADARIIVNGEEPFLQPGSIITLPMISHGKVAGIISLARNKGKEPFKQTDIEIGEILTSYATAALNLVYNLQEETELNTIENETDIAARIQKLLLPKKLVDAGGLNFSVLFNPVRGVCSDYYDVIQNQNDRLFCITADVAGKSIHACIVMVMIRSLLYLITNTPQNTHSIVDILNKGMTGKIAIDHYASLSFLTYLSDEQSIEYVNAGTQSLLLWKSRTKKIMKVEQKTDPIGVDIQSVYTCKKVTVEKGDIAVLFTDGIIEALNEKGEAFGLKALAGLIADHHSLPAKKITEKINNAIKTFMGKTPPHDDQTVMVIKVK
ncbi:MAG: PP2C family protein-serine/threonine phosphatase [Treponema sp.]